MISGAMRGKGGDALARHLLKAENDAVDVIAPRGLGSPDLPGQVRELVAMSLGGRTDAPIYHLHIDPEMSISDNARARAQWWSLFEREFGLAGQPFCGAVHVKHDRQHEHRVYGLVRRDGSVVDLAWDYARREKVSRIVEYEFGLPPVRSKHARAIARALRRDGRDDVAAWLEKGGMLDIERPAAALTPQERLIQERTGVRLADVRAAALAAWHAPGDGKGLQDALLARGLQLQAGRSGPVVVDAAGAVHLLTRLIGAASRAEGQRIPAAAIRARLASVVLAQAANGLAAALPRASTEPRHETGRGAGAQPAGPVYGPRRSPGRRHRAVLRRDERRRLEEIDRARIKLGNGLAVTDMHGIGILAPPMP